MKKILQFVFMFTVMVSPVFASAETLSITHNLYAGLRSPEVLFLQQTLQGFGYFPNTTPASGFFGTITKKAVEDFQKSNDVPSTGFVGPLTRAALSKLLSTATGTPVTTSPVTSNLLLDDAVNGTTATASVGQSLILTLHSTYWNIEGSGDSSVIKQSGEPVVMAKAPGVDCVPGGGCGTIETTFLAKGTGTTKITASRTTCGEAMMCAPDQRTFSLTVVVK